MVPPPWTAEAAHHSPRREEAAPRVLPHEALQEGEAEMDEEYGAFVDAEKAQEILQIIGEGYHRRQRHNRVVSTAAASRNFLRRSCYGPLLQYLPIMSEGRSDRSPRVLLLPIVFRFIPIVFQHHHKLMR